MLHKISKGKAHIDNRFSSFNIMMFVLVFGVLGSYLIINSNAAPLVVGIVEAERMSVPASPASKVITDASASSNAYVTFYSNGTANSKFTLASPATSIEVKARGSNCRGYAQALVSVDGTQLISSVVNGSWAVYSKGTSLKAGTHDLAVSFINDRYRAGVCDRNLDVDVVTVSSNTATTPAPTGGPTAPTGLTGSADGIGNINLHWSPSISSGGTINYQVSLSGWGVVATTAATSVTLTGATNGSTYTYNVQAIDSAGVTSPVSNSLSITPKAPSTTSSPAPTPTPAPTPAPAPAPTTVPSATGSLLWSDDFNGANAATIDSTKWDVMNWCDNWGSLSCNTNRSQNVSTDGAGHLKITAIKENYTDPYGNNGTYTAARIVSKYKMLRGTLQASIKIPHGKGLWPAFWGVTDHRTSDGTYGEYDVMEILGDNSYRNYCSIHGWTNSNGHIFGLTNSLDATSDLASGYHTYEMDWAPNVITYKIDGNVCHTYHSTDAGVTTWPFDTQGNIQLNLAVGGSWPGSPDASTVFPASMYVDWVRVYQ